MPVLYLQSQKSSVSYSIVLADADSKSRLQETIQAEGTKISRSKWKTEKSNPTLPTRPPLHKHIHQSILPPGKCFSFFLVVIS